MTIRRSITRSGSVYGAVAAPAAPGDDGTTTDDDGINDDDEASPQADMSPNPRGNGQSGREEAPCGEDPPRRHAPEPLRRRRSVRQQEARDKKAEAAQAEAARVARAEADAAAVATAALADATVAAAVAADAHAAAAAVPTEEEAETHAQPAPPEEQAPPGDEAREAEVAAHYARVRGLCTVVHASMTVELARSVLALSPDDDARRGFRRLARTVRLFKEGDRVFNASYHAEFQADQLLAGFTLARDVALGDADDEADVAVPFPEVPSPAFSDAFLGFVISKLERLEQEYEGRRLDDAGERRKARYEAARAFQVRLDVEADEQAEDDAQAHDREEAAKAADGAAAADAARTATRELRRKPPLPRCAPFAAGPSDAYGAIIMVPVSELFAPFCGVARVVPRAMRAGYRGVGDGQRRGLRPRRTRHRRLLRRRLGPAVRIFPTPPP